MSKKNNLPVHKLLPEHDWIEFEDFFIMPMGLYGSFFKWKTGDQAGNITFAPVSATKATAEGLWRLKGVR